MAPPRRMPTRALEHFRRRIKVLRDAWRLKAARSVDDDACDDGTPRARRAVLELDGVRPRSCVPRRAHDFRPAARVRAQPCALPYRSPVLLELALGGVV